MAVALFPYATTLARKNLKNCSNLSMDLSFRCATRNDGRIGLIGATHNNDHCPALIYAFIAGLI